MTKTLQTITTIELSSRCDMNCRYCIQSQLRVSSRRKPGIMCNGAFERSLVVLNRLVSRGTQAEVNLNGNGESLLDPDLVERVARVKKIMGDRVVMFCTNGKALTLDITKKLIDAGLDQLHLSIHSPYHSRRALDMLRPLTDKIKVVVNPGPITASHNWAGQLPIEDQVKHLPSLDCDPLIEGRGYISSEGFISPCCYDFDLHGVYTSVWDDDVLEREVKPYSLCDTCHQKIPQGLIEKECAA